MINNGKFISCFGCGVCATSCPRKAIDITLSDEGFWVPIVNTELCINCNICDKVCAYNDKKICISTNKLDKSKGYAVTHKNENIVKTATSGGAGFAIAQYLNQKGYKLVGVKYDADKNIACHFCTDSIEEFKTTMNSKYIPSYTVNGFTTLMDGNKYAVFGTPCQIDSLRRWARLKKKEENIIFIDLFCHGVPSYLHWNAYLDFHLKGKEKIIKPIFRDKINGWHAFTISLETNKRKITNTLQKNDLFQNLFFGNYTLNKTCYQCKYRGNNSAADIRMGDMWGGKYAHNEKGITGILALTTKGNEVVNAVGDLCSIIQESENVVVAGQIHKNTPIPQGRDKLLKGFTNKEPMQVLYYKYAPKMWMKNMIPYRVKCIIKQIIYKLKKK